MAGMALVSFSFPFINNFYVLGLALFLQGLCIAPLLPNGLSLVTDSVSPSQMTQAITLATAGIPLTGSLSSFLSGVVIDNYGASTALWLPFGFLACACLAMLLYIKEYKS